MVVTVDNGAVRIAQYYLRSHVDEFVDKEESALKHLLMDKHASPCLSGNGEQHAQKVGSKSRPRSIGKRHYRTVDERVDFVVVELRHEYIVAHAVNLHAKTGEGLDALRQAINGRLFKDAANSEDLWITSEREKACLEDALAGVDRVLNLLKNNPAVELLAFEMQLVRRALQSITGEISSEDILQSIFAGFCIGK